MDDVIERSLAPYAAITVAGASGHRCLSAERRRPGLTAPSA